MLMLNNSQRAATLASPPRREKPLNTLPSSCQATRQQEAAPTEELQYQNSEGVCMEPLASRHLKAGKLSRQAGSQVRCQSLLANKNSCIHHYVKLSRLNKIQL